MKKSLLHGFIPIVILVIISMTHSNQSPELDKKSQQDQSSGYVDPRLTDQLSQKFADLDKENIKYLTTPTQSVKHQEVAPVQKNDPKLENLINLDSNLSLLLVVGPFRCFAIINSASPSVGPAGG